MKVNVSTVLEATGAVLIVGAAAVTDVRLAVALVGLVLLVLSVVADRGAP